MIRRGNDALPFHPFDQIRRAVVADAQLTLNVTGGHFPVAQNDGDRLIIQTGAVAAFTVGIGCKTAFRTDFGRLDRKSVV